MRSSAFRGIRCANFARQVDCHLATLVNSEECSSDERDRSNFIQEIPYFNRPEENNRLARLCESCELLRRLG
jgi:hypothetical protein